MTNTTRTDADFDASYLRTWTEPDADQRRALIEQMWTPARVAAHLLTRLDRYRNSRHR